MAGVRELGLVVVNLQEALSSYLPLLLVQSTCLHPAQSAGQVVSRQHQGEVQRAIPAGLQGLEMLPLRQREGRVSRSFCFRDVLYPRVLGAIRS